MIGIIGIITVILWIAVSLSINAKKYTLPAEIQEQTKKLPDTIDKNTIRDVDQRRQYTQDELSSFPIALDVATQGSPTPKPSPSTAQQASGSAETQTSTQPPQIF
ncbi:MAG: hypothetical protein UX04_C0002G0039 [Microgenomates group bacterium GW2011_GWF2_45_18]|nr:MAG: hypothetical protein UW18_C0001G0058 [Microgenomates group bacterium GW2011_GWF1_44_10]KKU01896.1 MAG: hypothetical protein UX04_C0002G0039 [Microgenomates group bacterium GW2011_GWF2_45_18]